MHRTTILKTATLLTVLLLHLRAEGAILLNSPTTEWNAITYTGSSRSDYIDDEQTGINESDLVGSANGSPVTQTAFYFKYDSLSSHIGFRVRVDGDSNPPGYTGSIWVGLLLDAGDSIDLFAGYINKNARSEIGFYDPGTGANVSPSTTTINDNAPLFSTAATAANFLWTPVTVGPTGNDPVSGGTNDVGGDGITDYFATWVLSFSTLQTVAQNQGFTVTPESPFRFVVGTSEQSNSMNQDLNGTQGNTTSTSTFTSLGAVSPTVTASGGIIPEPASAMLVLVGGAYLGLRRKRG